MEGRMEKKFKIRLAYDAFCRMLDDYENKVTRGEATDDDCYKMVLAVPLADDVAGAVFSYFHTAAYGTSNIKQNVLDAAKATREFLSPDHKVKNEHIMSLVKTISEVYETGEIAWDAFAGDAEACGYKECINFDDMEDSVASVLMRVMSASMFDADYKEALRASGILQYLKH